MTLTDNKEVTFRHWVDQYSDLLYRHCLRYVADKEIAKDLLQDTFLSAWKNVDGYKGEASVKNWLFVILKNKITDHYRKSSIRFETQPEDYLPAVDHFFDEEGHWQRGEYPRPWSVNFSNEVECEEFIRIFSSCRSKLKQIQSKVFAMKYIDGLKSEDICKTLGITASNYWVLVHRAKVQLRACLEKHWARE